MQVENNNDVIDVKQLLGVLLSYKWLIAFITFLFCMVAIVYCLFRTPVYTSSILLKVSIPDQEKVITSRLILGKVVTDLQLNTQIVNFPGSKGHIGVEEYDVGAYWQDKTLTLVYTAPGQYNLTYNGEVLLTGVIDNVVVYQYGNPRKYIRLNINSIEAEVGSKFSLTQHNVSETVSQLQKKLKTEHLYKNGDVLKLALSGANREQLILILNKIANQYLDFEYQSATRASKKELSYLMDLQSGIQLKLHEAVNKLKAHTDGVSLNELLDPFVMTQSIKLGQYEAELVKLEARKNFLIKHPDQESIQEKVSIEQAIEATQQRIYLLQQELPFAGITADLIQLTVEKEKQSVLNAYILNLLDKSDKALRSTEDKVSILSPASYPQQAVNKPAKLIVVLAIILGLFLSVIYVFIWEYLFKGVQDPEKISSITKVKLLGVVFKLKRRPASIPKTFDMALIDYIKPYELEYYRQIRANILAGLRNTSHNIVVLTGVEQNIGNTFLCSNLAYIFASAGKRTLLLDSNFFLVNDEAPLAEDRNESLAALLKTQNLDSLQIKKTTYPALDYLPAGTLNSADRELLFSSDLSLLKQLSQRYEVVLVDNIALMQNSDALKLMEVADLNLLTLKFAKHSEDQIMMAMDKLCLNKIKLNGFILNQVDSNSYYGKKYKY